MSFFDDQPRIGDVTIAPEQAAPAPRLGPLDGAIASYRATTEVTNQLALDNGFRDAEQAQIQSIRAAGGAPHRSLNDVEDDSMGEAPYVSQMAGPTNTPRPYRAAADFYSSGGANDAQMAEVLGQRNSEIEALQKQYPQLGLKTYDQLWAQTQQNAQALSDRLAKSPTSLGGGIGEFLGGAAGSMSPRSAPLNFATLGVPLGEGAGLAARAAQQAGLGGASDAATQLLGGNADQALLLGTQDQGFSIGQVAEAAAGGALGELGFHAAGKLAGVAARGARKLFPDSDLEAPARLDPTPPDPGAMAEQPGVQFRQPDNLPKVSPLDDFETFRQGLNDYTAQTYGSTRLAEALGQIDSAKVHADLDAWDGPAPWEVAPSTDTAVVPDVTHVDFGAPLTRFLENEGPEAIARRMDPETFRQMDALSDQMEQSRQRLVDLTQQREQAADAHVADLQRQVDAAQQRADTATGKRRTPAQQQLAELTQQRDDARADFMDASTRPMAPLQRLGDDRALEQVPITEADSRRGAKQLILGDETDHIVAADGSHVAVGHPYDLGTFLDDARGQLHASDDPMMKLSSAVMSGVFKNLRSADKTPLYTLSREDAERVWPNNKAAGWYDPNNHYIVIKTDQFTTPANVTWIAGHEGVHAQHFWALEHSPQARNIVDYMSNIAQKFALDNNLAEHTAHYAYTNAHEFVSEALNNSRFQRYLASVPAPGDLVKALDLISPRSPVATLWDAFLEGARQILRLPKDQTSLLEAVIRYGEGLSALRDERPGVEGHAAGLLSASEPGITGYHASRANFDKFDLTKVLSGEGTALEGHGHYIAEDPETIKHYLQTLTGGKGNTYKVRVLRDVDHFIDRNKSLNAQSDYVQKIMQKLNIKEAAEELAPEGHAATGAELFKALENKYLTESLGARDPSTITRDDVSDMQRAASAKMHEAGLAGVRYSSPDAANGSKNLTVFDDNDIRVTHRNGKPLKDVLAAPETASIRYATPRDSVEMAAERANLMKIDEQQRDLSPLVSRAFAAAEGEWKAGRYNPDVIRFLRDLETHPRMRWKADAEQLQPAMPDPAWRQQEVKPSDALKPLQPPTLVDRAPELASRPDVTSQHPNEPAAKQMSAVLAANAKDFEPQIERFQQTIGKLLAEGAEDNTIRINGQELHLDRDRITVPTADGEGMKDVSVRSFLRDLNDDHEAYKAIGTCNRS